MVCLFFHFFAHWPELTGTLAPRKISSYLEGFLLVNILSHSTGMDLKLLGNTLPPGVFCMSDLRDVEGR